MARPENFPLWASSQFNYDIAVNSSVETVPNKVPLPESIKTQGILWMEPLSNTHLNYQFDLINQWITYYASPEVTIVSDSTTARTLSLADKSRYLNFTNATPVAVTVPLNVFPVGSTLTIHQDGAGQVTVSGASGVTLKAPFGLANKTAGNGATIVLTKFSEVAGVSEVWHTSGQAGA